MNLRFFSGIFVFAIACVLQFSFAPAGSVNLIFAALIAFAFVFPRRGGFFELLFFVLLGVFIMNWQPAPSIAIIAFAIIPCAAYFSRIAFPWEPWTGTIISLFAGFVIFYLIADPQSIITASPSFLLNLLFGSAFGFMVFFSMDHAFGTNARG